MRFGFHPVPKERPALLQAKDRKRLKVADELRIKKAVRARDGQQCQCCHVPVFPDAKNPLQRAQVHHIQFRSKGGNTDMKNQITLCAECHAKIHAREVQIVGSNAMTVRFVKKGRP